jgi:hypothetical protein
MTTRKQLFKLIFYIGFVIGLYPIANAQQKSNFSLLLGANINNPHQLLENSNNPNDVNTINNTQKAYGNMWAGLSYRNTIQLSLSNELNISSFNITNADLFITGRVYLAKEKHKIKPYVEGGSLINNYGDVSILKESLFGYVIGLGVIYKINKIISLELSTNYISKDYKYNILARPTDLPVEVDIDRIIVKTGLIFKVL